MGMCAFRFETFFSLFEPGKTHECGVFGALLMKKGGMSL